MSTEQSLLITCSRLVDLAGSEITTLELAEAFASQGWAVTVAAFEVSAEMRDRVGGLGARFIDLSAPYPFKSNHVFDLAWLHHSVTAYRVLTEPTLVLRKVIFSSLSHFSALEGPPLTRFQLSRYLVNSQENLEHFLVHYPELSHAVMVMNNSVPARYWHIPSAGASRALGRLAIVSNHLPDEVLQLTQLLEGAGIVVEVLGVTGRQVLITPDALRNYDAVMTIGKTVQYAIAAGVPVYCYDHFGGDGWVTPATFQQGRKYNFSGRNSRGSISAQQLLSELCGGYAAALAGVEELFAAGRQHFVLEANISRVLEGLAPYDGPELSLTDSNALVRGTSIFTELRALISYRDALINDLRLLLHAEQENAAAQVAYRDEQVAELEALLAAEKRNAAEQIAYRDEQVAELEALLAAEKQNAAAQIDYREALISELKIRCAHMSSRLASLEARLRSRYELLKCFFSMNKEDQQ